jgi:hypothetical protein
MTITLTGLIQCVDGRFRVSRAIEACEGFRVVAGEKIRFSDDITLRVDQITWEAPALLDGTGDVIATIQVSPTAAIATRDETEARFRANGFEIEEVEP